MSLYDTVEEWEDELHGIRENIHSNGSSSHSNQRMITLWQTMDKYKNRLSEKEYNPDKITAIILLALECYLQTLNVQTKTSLLSSSTDGAFNEHAQNVSVAIALIGNGEFPDDTEKLSLALNRIAELEGFINEVQALTDKAQEDLKNV